MQEQSFLARLLKKEADVRQSGAENGKDTSAATKEVERQIKQATKGNPNSGKGVTKSGVDD